MSYEANCSADAIASFFRMIDFYEKEVEEKLQKRDEVMRLLAAEAGKTFMYEGQIYQICERHNKLRGCKVPFFKRLPNWPKKWLDKQARANRVPGLRYDEPRLTEDEVDLGQSTQEVDVVDDLGGDLPLSDSMLLNTAEHLWDAGATPTEVIID